MFCERDLLQSLCPRELLYEEKYQVYIYRIFNNLLINIYIYIFNLLKNRRNSFKRSYTFNLYTVEKYFYTVEKFSKKFNYLT